MSEFEEVLVLFVGPKWPKDKKAHEDLVDEIKLHLVHS